MPSFYHPPDGQNQMAMNPYSFGNPELTVDMLGTMMQMQGLDSQPHPNSAAPAQALSPQALLEQQFKINQLQQLQQLQNHIFQQQARPSFFS